LARLLIAAAAFVAAAQQGTPQFHLSGPTAQGSLVRGSAPEGTIQLTLNGRELALAPDGQFVIGFDRDATREAVLVARLASGEEIGATLEIARRDWPVQHVNMARPSGGPTPEYQQLREGELQRIGAARARRSVSPGWRQSFIWPARGRVTGRFGSQRIYRGGVRAAYHSGADIAAGAGAAVVAPADGIVTLAPPPGFSLEGNLVILDHGMGLTSAFLHLSGASVRAGQAVRQGERIGTVGATGRATGPHLHWSLVWNGARIDPAAVVAR
jgi:murein DD-endopeptidase MepM/ murein hydrolase activator NlpD